MNKTYGVILFATLTLVGASDVFAQSEGHWRRVENRDLAVRSQTFVDSGFSVLDWEAFIKKGGNPFGKNNHFFKMEIRDKVYQTTQVVSMIPVGLLWLSQHSRFVAVLSTDYPTDGVVVLSRSGSVEFKRYGICFRGETCPLVSDGNAPWYDHFRVDVAFSSNDSGQDCLLEIQPRDDSPRSSAMSIDVCKKTVENVLDSSEQFKN